MISDDPDSQLNYLDKFDSAAADTIPFTQRFAEHKGISSHLKRGPTAWANSREWRKAHEASESGRKVRDISHDHFTANMGTPFPKLLPGERVSGNLQAVYVMVTKQIMGAVSTQLMVHDNLNPYDAMRAAKRFVKARESEIRRFVYGV